MALTLTNAIKPTLARLYDMLNEQELLLKKNPNDWTAKHCIASIRDSIGAERAKKLDEEKKKLIEETGRTI